MARRHHEQRVIDDFGRYLGATTRRVWTASPDEISTTKNERYYDCEFTSPESTPIAVDICSLFPTGSHPNEEVKHAKFSDRLLVALGEVGVGGLMIETPPIEKKHADPNWPRKTAQKIHDILSRQPLSSQSAEIEIEGCKVKRIGGACDPSFTYRMEFSGIQPADRAGYPLAILLRKKHDQLDVDGHGRYLVVVNDGRRAHTVDVRQACAFIDFEQYPNFDRIYFEESEANFYLVYDRDAWRSLEIGRLPEDGETRSLVVLWVEARLSGAWPGALTTALQICCDQHNCDWLTEGGRELLRIEAHLLLLTSKWETPRRLWEVFRGPLPDLVDARRRAVPIVVPPV